MFGCRIVVYGDDMLQAVVPNSAKPFNFQKAYGLSEEQVCFHAFTSQNLTLIRAGPEFDITEHH